MQDLADHAALQAGAWTLTPEPLSLTEVVEATVQDMASLLAGHVVVLEPGESSTVADRRALERVVANLVANAVRYSPAGSPIRVRTGGDKATVTLTVSDEGRGIDASDLTTVLEDYERGRLATADGGTGLGLSSVRRLVELHGGAVRLDSAGEGRGTTVTVELPAGDRAVSPAPPPRRP